MAAIENAALPLLQLPSVCCCCQSSLASELDVFMGAGWLIMLNVH